jgi:hypothetical protein
MTRRKAIRRGWEIGDKIPITRCQYGHQLE